MAKGKGPPLTRMATTKIGKGERHGNLRSFSVLGFACEKLRRNKKREREWHALRCCPACYGYFYDRCRGCNECKYQHALERCHYYGYYDGCRGPVVTHWAPRKNSTNVARKGQMILFALLKVRQQLLNTEKLLSRCGGIKERSPILLQLIMNYLETAVRQKVINCTTYSLAMKSEKKEKSDDKSLKWALIYDPPEYFYNMQ